MPFPWTQSKLMAAHAFIQELEKLSDDEKAMLETSLDDMIREAPSAPTAAMRFKRLMTKAGSTAASGLREIVIDLLSEYLKKLTFG